MGVIFAGDQEGDFEDTETGSEAETGDQDSAEDASDEGADDTDDSSSEDDDSADDKDTDKDEDKGDDEDAPKRKTRTPADWVALRRGKKLEKQSKSGTQGEDGGQDEGDEGDDDEVTRKVKEVVGKALSPIISQQEQAELETEISSFVADNPEFKPYAAKVAKWSQDPDWANVPIDRVFYAVAGKDLLRIGATRRAAADANARKNRTGGGQGQGEGTKSWNDVPLDDVGKEIERIKLQR